MQQPIMRQRRTRIRRGADKPDRKPSKAPPCVARLVVEDLQIQGHAFLVTVFNSGNLPSYHVRINVYLKPVTIVGEPEADLVLVATGSTTLGILERKQVSVIKEVGAIAVFNRHYAIAFDPINDPFPIGHLRELSLQEQNLLQGSLRPSLPGWKQYQFNDDRFRFDEAVPVPEANQTWQLKTIAQLGTEVPVNSSIVNVLYPHATPGAHSEFRYRGDIDNAFWQREITKSNVTVQTSCFLYTYDQTPRDRGALWLRLSRVQSGIESVLSTTEDSLSSPDAWLTKQGHIAADPALTTITVRLIAERRTGNNNNSYFGNVRCALKHRQVKAS